MRLHTKLCAGMLDHALALAKDEGLIGPGVQFTEFELCTSRSHAYAFEIRLGTADYEKLPEPGQRYGTSLTRHRARDGITWAASWREWGWFMAEVYTMDPEAKWNSCYRSMSDFHAKTSHQFEG